MKLLDKMYLNAKSHIMNFVEDFKKNEMGVSSIVATVLLILVVVLLVSMFWDLISEWLEATWIRIIGSDTIGNDY